MKSIDANEVISGLINSILKNELSGNILLPKLDKYVREKVLNDNISQLPEFVRMHKYFGLRAMYSSYFRNYDKGIISPKVTNRILKTLLSSVIFGNKEVDKSIEDFQSKFNQLPPDFITISPTNKCNLNCAGCDASSKATGHECINWALLNKIIEDAYSNMGIRFFVISGGEPLLYISENKTILDLARQWSDCYFMMYTNGTLISEEVASEMASLGNITPVISIEGFAAHTNNRRGNGIYQRILKAKDNLIKNGVPFGLSITATKENIDLLLNEIFYSYHFNTFGATYMWIFQYMPVDGEFSTNLMITPEQQVELFQIQKRIVIENKFFVTNFWNSVIPANGTLSCGKPAGYFYVNWEGNIIPCGFVSHIDNVNSLYNSGKTLSDALFSPFFEEGRKWQSGYLHGKDKLGNLLMPCFYYDQHKDFVELAKNTGAKT